jgi:hypothetical protein
MASMIQLVFAFLTCSGLLAVDWGAATKTEADVRAGGIAGAMIGVPLLAVLSLLIVAGSLGRSAANGEATSRSTDPIVRVDRPAVARLVPFPPAARAENARTATLRAAFQYGMGGRAGGTILLVLSLGLLGPICACPFVIAKQLSQVWPRPRLDIPFAPRSPHGP